MQARQHRKLLPMTLSLSSSEVVRARPLDVGGGGTAQLGFLIGMELGTDDSL
jgi:hypothetical protein